MVSNPEGNKGKTAKGRRDKVDLALGVSSI